MRGRTALAAFAALATLTGGVATMVNRQLRDATDVRGYSNTVWLSGEASGSGRVVLGAVGAERPSVGVTLTTEGDSFQFDVRDAGDRVFVHDRISGAIQVLDGRDATLLDSFDGPVPPDDRAVIVLAGEAVFVIDPTRQAARRIEANNQPGPETIFEDPMTDWVGTSDGRLWVLDDAEGIVSNFDGKTVSRVRFAEPKSDLTLSAIGKDAVVLDRTASRLRWLRRSESIEIPTDAKAIVQEPNLTDEGESCVQVLADDVLGCYSVDGEARTMPFASEWMTGSETLVVSRSTAVVASASSSVTHVASWTDQTTVEDTRPNPSARRPFGVVNLGSVLLDDPGSQYALTVDRARIVPLDKLSKQTIVLSTDGSAINSVSLADTPTDAGVEAAIPGQSDAPNEIDSDGLNDEPIAVGDTAITRRSQTKLIDVLANDRDPDGDLLIISDVTVPKPFGTAEIVGKTKIQFTPDPDGPLGPVTFEYTIEDPSKLTASATVTVTVVSDDQNTQPELKDDEATTPQGAAIDIPVLDNDTDADGDTLNISSIGQPSKGTVSPQAGKIHYEPRPDAVGDDFFTYSAVDGYGDPVTANVKVTITVASGVNLPPKALPDRVTTSAGVSIRVPVLENDSDPESAPLKVKSVGEPGGAAANNGVEITVVGDGTVVLLPQANVSGLISIAYTIEDPEGLVASSVIGLVVDRQSANRPPVAVDDSQVAPSAAINISPLANDLDPDNDPLVIASVSQPKSGGSVTKLSPTLLRFDPAPDQVGKSVRFRYRVSDPEGQEAQAWITVQVIAPTGSGPIARDDSATIKVGESATLDVRANDVHPDQLPFNIVGQPTASEGTARVNGDSTITFTPPARLGTYTYGYTIQDGNFRSSSATVSITVEAAVLENRPPVASPDSYSAIAGAPAALLDVLANDLDPESDPLTLASVSAVAPPGSANVSISGGRVRFSSSDSGLVTFTYSVTDPKGLSANGTVTVQVAEPIKLPPLAKSDLKNITLPSGAVDVDPLQNDSDPEGGSLRISAVGTPSPSGLVVSVSSDRQTIRVTPPTVTTSTSFNFSYTITDEQSLTATSTITIVVDPPPNSPPVAVADAVTIQPIAKVIDVVRNDRDVDGGRLTIVSVSSVSPSGGGRVAITNNQVTFTPSSYRGLATFTYTIQDPEGLQSTATVSVTVDQCSQSSPVVSDDSAAAPFGSRDIFIFANDSRTEGVLSFTQPTGGSVTEIGTGVLRFTPNSNPFVGSTSFNYTITNGCDDQASATVRISGNRLPVAGDDSFSIAKNRRVNFAVLSNDSDPDAQFGDSISLSDVGDGAHGSTSVVNGQVSYNPVNGYVGADSFTYTIEDQAGQTSTATVSVTIGNSPPVVIGESSETTSGESVNKNVLSNDSDPDNDTLSISGTPSLSPSGAGTLTVGSGGQLTYRAGSSFVGLASVTYTVSDGNASASGTWTIDVTSPNRPPVANPDTITITAGTSASLNPTSNDSDPDLTPVTLVSVSSQTGVSTVVNGNSVQISVSTTTPAVTVALTYVITDGSLQATSTITVTVEPAVPPNGPPEIGDKSGTIGTDDSQSFDLICCGDSDPDGDTLTVTGSSVTAPGSASVTVGSGSVSITTTGAAVGATIVVSYTVSDGQGHEVSATLIVTVVGPPP